jgi:hypothetical protein
MKDEPSKFESDTPSLTGLLVFNVVALLAVQFSQAYFRQRFSSLEIDLPHITELGIGLLSPFALALLLVATFFVKHFAPTSFKNGWKIAAVCACGSIVGFYSIAMFAAFPIGPGDLTR